MVPEGIRAKEMQASHSQISNPNLTILNSLINLLFFRQMDELMISSCPKISANKTTLESKMATSTSSPRSAFWSVPDSPQSHSQSPPHSATESVPVADIWDPVSPPPTQKYPKLTPPSSATSSKGKSVAFADDEQADPNLKAKRIKLVPFVVHGANAEGDNDEVEDDENEQEDRADDRRFKLQFHVNDVIQVCAPILQVHPPSITNAHEFISSKTHSLEWQTASLHFSETLQRPLQ